MPVRYLTEPWAQEALKRVETDPRIQDAVSGLRISILTIVLRAPANAYGFLYVAFDEHGLSEYRVGHDYHVVAAGIPKPTFVVSGDYEVFTAVQRGELSEKRALLTGKLHLTGSLIKALRYMNALEAVTEVLREIPVEAEPLPGGGKAEATVSDPAAATGPRPAAAAEAAAQAVATARAGAVEADAEKGSATPPTRKRVSRKKKEA